MKVQAAVTHAQGQPFAIEEVRLAGPGPNEVLVRIVATGVCHTDAVGRDLGVSPYPVVLGHEGAGVIEQVGDNVTRLAAGDHVVLSFAHCGQCNNCLTGHPTVCSIFNDLNFGGQMEDQSWRLYQGETPLSTFFGQSSFSTHVVAHERNVVKVDP
ncbi:MAG: alcohol dehydrogenase catalytic domain-containing protein, partial [Spongiibacteraceae bacterium]|nr:alcohol dehydrogenase catalytic domain-containing protein [Spongiibacteraceae bacterium]